MYTNIIHNDDICNYFLKNQQFIFNSLGNCRECRNIVTIAFFVAYFYTENLFDAADIPLQSANSVVDAEVRQPAHCIYQLAGGDIMSQSAQFIDNAAISHQLVQF